MDKFDRIYALHTLLSSNRYPVSKETIQEQLECSHSTVERIIHDMRLYLEAPIEYERDAKGYFYNKNSTTRYELPGLWFNASELYALLVSHHLLSMVEPGLLENHIEPLTDKIESLLKPDTIKQGELDKRIRILKMSARKPNPKHFSKVATALLKRQQMNISYRGRARDKTTRRKISPQRLVHYRDNWYLDAWCHLRESMRSFSLDRINKSISEKQTAIDIDDTKLDEHYASSYGIFAGKPKYRAKLKFTPMAARWVADEQWHPEQKGQFDIEGFYELEIPYFNPKELIRDILKFGPDVKVISPPQLKKDIKAQLKQAVKQYSE